MKITVRNGNVEQAIRTMKRKLQDDGRLREVRDRAFYEKPCQKRNRRKQAAVVREHKRINDNK